MRMILSWALALLIFFSAVCLRAQVPQLINYQGRIVVGTTNFDGTGQFKFAFVDATGANTYWSNDGTSVAGSQPTNAVSLTVTKGFYSVLLGDATLTNMAVVPVTVFTHPDVRLRVWFNDGSAGFQLLTPDQRIAAVGYAITAAGVQLPVTANATQGVISQNGGSLIHTYGVANFFAGAGAGNFSMTGSYNNAVGYQALAVNTSGNSNTANGYLAITANTTGTQNSASGYLALSSNITGSQNSALGAFALQNAEASNNTAVGYSALQSDLSNTSNTAVGWSSLRNLASGNSNTALGNATAVNLTSGNGNIIIGSGAGSNLTVGTGNIEIGNAGLAGETAVVRIGTNQTDTYLSGIIHGNGSGLTNLPAANILGTITSAQLSSGLTLGGTTSGTFSGPLTGNVTGSAGSFTGSLAGDVTGTQGATVVATVGGSTAAKVHSAEVAANNASEINNGFVIVRRDVSGSFGAGSITLSGWLTLPVTTSTAGTIYQNSKTLLHTFGTENFFAGAAAGNFTMDGGENTGIGVQALGKNTSGSFNTAVGDHALNFNLAGTFNTGVGFNALGINTGGNKNTALGYETLWMNTNGSENTAVGASALLFNTLGTQNTALGYQSMTNNVNAGQNVALGHSALMTQSYDNGGTVWNSNNVAVGFEALKLNQPTSTANGKNNTAVGSNALTANTTGVSNTATGHNALLSNTTASASTASGDGALRNSNASNNAAFGWSALTADTTGGNNTALGTSALINNTSGSNNIAIGNASGSQLTTGDNNIQIGNQGVAGDANTIRIGTVGTQTATLIAGINGVTTSGGAAVFIDSNGQLGTITSSRRFKDNIQDMDKSSEALLALRPVTFQYKPEIDPKGVPQFGLIAEEVEKVDSDLVVRNDKGQVQTVRYEQVNAMLLNEFLKEHQRVKDLEKRLLELEARDQERENRLKKLEQAIPPAPETAKRGNAP